MLREPPPRSRTNINRANLTTRSSLTQTTTMTPQRPSRANTDTLNDLFRPQPSALVQHCISVPAPPRYNGAFYANPAETMPPVASTSLCIPQVRRSLAGVQQKDQGKKGMLGFMSDFLWSNKPVVINTPYNPVHLTYTRPRENLPVFPKNGSGSFRKVV